MIAINFASANYRLSSRIMAGLLAGSAVLALIAGVLLWQHASLRRDSWAIEQKLKESEAASEKIRPVLEERERLVKDLTSMSGLLESRRFSWTRLLSSIEAIVPVGVAMRSVDFDPRERALSLEGTAQSPEALRNLVIGLEKSSTFKDPFLKHQSLEKGSISFNVVAVYHEPVGGAVAAGKK
jgi:Tfp pilus assembly protein PilN